MAVGQRAQLARRLAANDTVAGEDQRKRRRLDEAGRRLERRVVRRRPSCPLGRERRAVGRFFGHVFRHLDVTRARLLRLGQLECFADDLGDDGPGLEPRVPLRQRAKMLDDVDVLVRFLVDAVTTGLPRDGDERRVIEVRIGDAGGEIGGARSERREAHAGAARQAAAGVGHEGSALLVARRDEADRRVGERIQDVENLLPGQAEDVPDALVLEAPHDQLRRLHRPTRSRPT